MTDTRKRTTRELSADADGVPKKYDFTAAEPKGHKGLCLHRDEELDEIHDYFMRQWEPEKYGPLLANDPMAYLITNAPGAGKTTLREEAARRMMLEGVTVIELEPRMLANDERFVDGLVRHAQTDEEDLKPHAGKSFIANMYGAAISNVATVPLATGLTAGALIGLGAPAVLVPIGAAITGVAAASLRERREQTKQALAKGMPKNPVEALQLLSRTHNGRFLVTVDEVQGWGGIREGRSTLETNIGLLTSPSARGADNITGGGLLMSGLGDSPEHFDGLGLSRAKAIWLSELREEDSAKVIAHYINAMPLKGQIRERVRDQWCEALATQFTHWPQHSSAAGLIASLTLRQAEEDATALDPKHDELLLNRVKACTARAIARLYDDRIQKAGERSYEDMPAVIVAMADLTDNRMSLKTVDYAIEVAAAASDRDADEARCTEVRGTLLRSGLLRPNLNPKTRYLRDVMHYSIGIPSIRDFIRDGTPTDVMQEFLALNQEMLDKVSQPGRTARERLARKKS